MMKNLSKLILLLSLSSANLCFAPPPPASTENWYCRTCYFPNPPTLPYCCMCRRAFGIGEILDNAALARFCFENKESELRAYIDFDETEAFNALLEEHQAFLDAQAALASSSASSSSSSEAAPRAKSPSRGRRQEDDEVRSTYSHDSKASFQTRFSVASGFMPNTPEFPENTSEMISEIKAIRESNDIQALVNFTRWAGWDKGYNIVDRATGLSKPMPYLNEDEIRILFQFKSNGASLGDLRFEPGREMPRAHWRFVSDLIDRSTCQPMVLSVFLFLAKGTICFNPKLEQFVPNAMRTAMALLKATLDQSKLAPRSGAPRAYAPRFAASSSSPAAPTSGSSPK